MNFLLAVSLVILLCDIIRRFLRCRKWRWSSPPGPWRLPFLDHLHYQLKEPLLLRTFSSLADEFGPIFRFDILGKSALVINDAVLVKELFNEPSFSGRPEYSSFDFVGDGKSHGVLFSQWKEAKPLRSFLIKRMRQFRLSGTAEAVVTKEAEELITLLEEKGKQGNSIGGWREIFFTAAFNPLWKFSVGKRFSESDEPEVFSFFAKAQGEITKLMSSNGGLLLLAPDLAAAFPNVSGYNKTRAIISRFTFYLKALIEEHKSEISGGRVETPDFIHSFLTKMEEEEDPQGVFSEDNLIAMLGDFYVAGIDANAGMLSWLILYLSKLPSLQEEFQAEISKVTEGNKRRVSLADYERMPFAQALFQEVLRHSSISPFGELHTATEGKWFRDIYIPEGTLLIANIYYIHHNKRFWENPESFNPKRFLRQNEMGQTVFEQPKQVIPFSIGRRQCPALNITSDIFFLFSGHLFQHFIFEFDKAGPDTGFEPQDGLDLAPKPFRVFVKRRETI